MLLIRAKNKNRTKPFFDFLSYIMEKVDLVIVGAEGVVENGGIINKVGASVFPSSLLKAGECITDLGHQNSIGCYGSFI